MILPDLQTARSFLRAAGEHNPGRWVTHSEYVAEAAFRIAGRLPGVDPDSARILGLLHDIGRRAGVTGMRHVYDGYRFLMAEGFPDAARICLTHSYPVKDVRSGSDRWDGTEAELAEVERFLDGIEFDDCDRLIQLCDALALPTGFCLIEKRLVDVLMRYHNYNAFTVPKWEALFAIRKDFERRIGGNIYDLLPGVVEETFRSAA